MSRILPGGGGRPADVLLFRRPRSGLARGRPSGSRHAFLDYLLFDEGVDVGAPEDSPPAEFREGKLALGHQLEEQAPADPEIVEDVGEAQDLLAGFHEPDFIRSTPENQRKNSLTGRRPRIYKDLRGLKQVYNDFRERRQIFSGASPLDLQRVRLSLSFHPAAGTEDVERRTHVHLRAVSAGGAERTGAQQIGRGYERGKMKHPHLFAVLCRRCGRTFIFERPRRRLGWIPLPEGHGPGQPCPGSFVFLHHRERTEALRTGGRA